jgi:hypothetical protein
MLPVFSRKVVEGEQRVAILDQALDRCQMARNDEILEVFGSSSISVATESSGTKQVIENA